MRTGILSGVALLAVLVVTYALAPAASPEPSGPAAAPMVSPGVPHPGSDQIYWVPTFAQAQAVARATGRLMLVIGSVGDWNGY